MLEALDFDFVNDARFRLRYTLPDGRCPVVGRSCERIASSEEIILGWIWKASAPLAVITMRVAGSGKRKFGPNTVPTKLQHTIRQCCCYWFFVEAPAAETT